MDFAQVSARQDTGALSKNLTLSLLAYLAGAAKANRRNELLEWRISC
jgi:hypothetical protein